MLDRIDQRDMFDSAVTMLIDDPTDSSEPNEPMLAIDRADPTLPIDSSEPSLAMQSTESRDQSESNEPPASRCWALLAESGRVRGMQ